MSTKKTFSTETSERYSRALFEVVKEAEDTLKRGKEISTQALRQSIHPQ